MSADPILREVNEQKEKLDNFINQFSLEQIPNGDDHFSQSEADDIKERLKALEQQLTKELKNAIDDKKQLAAELSELKKEFNTLKQIIPNLTKKGWFKSAMSKLYIWGSKKQNQKLLQATANYGKALIHTAKEVSDAAN
jgi:archaellum component FlaC